MVEKFNFETINIEIPERNNNSHKGDFGRVAVLGGSEGMGGAAILSSEASLFSGAGLTHLYTHSTNVEAGLQRNPEIMSLGINSNFEIPNNLNRAIEIEPNPFQMETYYWRAVLKFSMRRKERSALDRTACSDLRKAHKAGFQFAIDYAEQNKSFLQRDKCYGIR